MSSNLPPGCSSADGGIDHQYEGALDNLCDQMQDHNEVALMERLARVVLPWVRDSYQQGVKDGRHEAEQEAADKSD